VRGPGTDADAPPSLRSRTVSQPQPLFGDGDQLPMSWPEAAPAPYAHLVAHSGPPEPPGLTADTALVSKYFGAYRLVIVTNLRDFLTIGEGPDACAAKLASRRLAADSKSFWDMAATLRKSADRIGRAFGEYLKRALTQSVALREPKDVAWFIASYARDALNRVEDAGGLPALANVRASLESHLMAFAAEEARLNRRVVSMDEFRARRVVDALRDRGVNAHFLRGGVGQFGVRVSLPGGREAEWDTDGTAGLEAQVMRDGMLVGYVPQIDGSEDFDESQIVDAIARTDYDQPIAHQRRTAPPPAAPAPTRSGCPAPARSRGLLPPAVPCVTF